MHLVFDAKDRKTFHSGRWNRGYNPDLCIVSKDKNHTALQDHRIVINNFLRSQHRLILINVGIQIPIVKTIQKPRWNFRKADWNNFKKSLDSNIRWIQPTVNNYDRFVGVVKEAAKRQVPRDYRREYILCWNDESDSLYIEYQKNGRTEIADKLLLSLAKSRKDRWAETMEKLDFKRSSREASNVLRKLKPSPTRTKGTPKIKPNTFANLIVEMSRARLDKKSAREVTSSCRSRHIRPRRWRRASRTMTTLRSTPHACVRRLRATLGRVAACRSAVLTPRHRRRGRLRPLPETGVSEHGRPPGRLGRSAARRAGKRGRSYGPIVVRAARVRF